MLMGLKKFKGHWTTVGTILGYKIGGFFLIFKKYT